MMMDKHAPGTDEMSREALAEKLRIAVGRLARRLRQQALGGLTPSQRSVLTTLGREGPVRMGRLAELERISKVSATRIVGRLEERGMVERSADPDDGRVVVVGASGEALDILRRSRAEKTAFLAQTLADLDADELAILDRAADLLERFIEEPR